MLIDKNTRISELIKANPLAIDAIASINSKFEKLRNPVLRKLLAPRVSIHDASRIGNCSLQEMFAKLSALGFKVNEEAPVTEEEEVKTIPTVHVFEASMDVRLDIVNGKDPLKKILIAVRAIKVGQTIRIINSFEPVPLIRLLENKGFKAQVVPIGPNEVHTFFHKYKDQNTDTEIEEMVNDFESIHERFKGRFEFVDVREMEMPLPMVTILNTLKTLKEARALFVEHKKMPVFLLPELQERNFKWCMNEISEAHVQIIIYRDDERS